MYKNEQIDKIFNEINEIGLRDLNQNDINENENVFLFKPGIVSLLKNKFSNINNEGALYPRSGYDNRRHLNDFTLDKMSAIEINNEEAPCKNIVSDTRRVFECIVPKEGQDEELYNTHNKVICSTVPLKLKTFDQLITTNYITKTKQFSHNGIDQKPKISRIGVFAKEVENDIHQGKNQIVEFKRDIKTVTAESIQTNDYNISQFNAGLSHLPNNINQSTHPNAGTNGNLSSFKGESFPLKENYNGYSVSQSTDSYPGNQYNLKPFQNALLPTQPIRFKKNEGIDMLSNSSNEMNQWRILSSENKCNFKSSMSKPLPKSQNDISDSGKHTDIKPTDKSIYAQPPSASTNRLNGIQNREKSRNAMTNQSKSFIFNASDFADARFNNTDIIDDFPTSDIFETIPKDALLKSILKDRLDKTDIKVVRNISFANNNLLITVHVYEREDSSSLDENAIEAESIKPDYCTSPLSLKIIDTDSNIYCDNIVNDVMEFKVDMLF